MIDGGGAAEAATTILRLVPDKIGIGGGLQNFRKIRENYRFWRRRLINFR